MKRRPSMFVKHLMFSVVWASPILRTTIPPEAIQSVTRSMESRCSQQQSTSCAPRRRAREESMAFDGRITQVVEPGSSTTSSSNIELRRSTSRRTQVEHV